MCRSLGGFFCECALESTAGLWASSYLVQRRGVPVQTAAGAGALFYLGITLGRLLAGCFAERIGDRKMIGSGLCIAAAGILLLPVSAYAAACGFFVIGFGCAPVYPCQIHDAAVRFRGTDTQTLIGVQMACAYLGTTLMPPLFGMLAEHTGFSLLPLFLLCFLRGAYQKKQEDSNDH